MEQQINKQVPEVSPCYIADDEIDLVQLFQILLKRKWMILGVIFVCLLGGFGYVLSKGSIYEYTTTLQIGTALIESGNMIEMSTIEDSASVKLKVEKVYIPSAVNLLS